MFDDGEYSSSATMASECFRGLNSLSKKNKKNKNKKRFSDEQIRSLETMFESETKLEPRKKMQLARELGLQPRQVAIWFQNKRARWKSKQLERDYGMLRANYNILASQFEALKKEKQSSLVQVQKLNELVEKSREKSKICRRETTESSIDDKTNNTDTKTSEPELKPCLLSLERSEHEIAVLSDNDSSIKTEYFGLDEEHELLNMVESGDGSLTSPENWESFESNGLYDQSGSSGYQWWDFWS